MKDQSGTSIGNVCTLIVGYEDPISGTWQTWLGVLGTGRVLDNNIIGRDFLNAISTMGILSGVNYPTNLKNDLVYRR